MSKNLNQNTSLLCQITQLTKKIQQHEQQEQILKTENQKVKVENTALLEHISILQKQQEEHINEIENLKQLIQRISQEKIFQTEYQEHQNNIYKDQNKTLTKALSNLQNNLDRYQYISEISQNNLINGIGLQFGEDTC
ncbi:unnamed protein product [Paramecium sonneborni]|uniref:Uncharacterized protein n=1 Tax=Paramecium sonneborni TaxID=65129 RepID=A0A8S1PDT6_9CILI|nr:unnamed protein product [Paramecium sonneborni]